MKWGEDINAFIQDTRDTAPFASTQYLGGTGGSASTDTALYPFETGIGGWHGNSTGDITKSVALDSSKAFAGSKSLAVSVNASGAGWLQIRLNDPPASLTRNKTATLRVHIPSGAPVREVFAVTHDANYSWDAGAVRSGASAANGEWQSYTAAVPGGASVKSNGGINAVMLYVYFTGT